MATNINIRRDVKDQYYRYKMPRLHAKVEGKGNGIKTVLPNIVDVAKALSRPPLYPTKYFGFELGAQARAEEKNDRYIVNGAHEAERLQQLLDGFIERFVLCGNCKSPETDLKITKEQTIMRECMACGQPSNVDMGHKMSAYIFKNPPPKEKKGGKHAAAQANNSAHASGDEELDQLVRDAAALEVSDDDDWGYDEDVVGDMKPAGAFAAHDDDDEEETEQDPFELLANFIEANADASDDAVHAKAVELGLGKNHRALVVVIQCLFTGSKSLLKDIARHKPLLTKFGRSDKHQRAVIGGFERLIEADMDGLLSKTSMVLVNLFQNDIVDEEQVREWGRRPSKKYVDKDAAKRIHKAAQQFMEWLDTAESESESE
ncbi:eukaryotic translation initiation factor 5 [Coemansia sp. RSA 2523]|nr:eukaryotic translation initiation factor 5 [Coemansia sp. RSA 1752]KAJ1778162.1 eukaryotic translation initiation factor 5 [Coemansia sp. RSA 1824]KAJ1791785.1 eukaryotic translation initiation factor 5 [Coemansia sp. RSA 1938]KAJ1808402.1 eukaryotic translation initiation factor 5 [Coemansia sp. RSA 2523]KAJ2139117.1 eukaryotic translation initiation factor 5 [Coemansia sp. RSA 788]KAJ2167868.1 eukaryotic translation initiation factor 5 [Coemansia sp. RSA 562]KAJ2182267.1 eukaryotic trans